MPSVEPSSDGPVPAKRQEAGLGGLLGATGNLAITAGGLAGRLTFRLGSKVVESGVHMLEDAQQGKPSAQIASDVLTELVGGARDVLDQELQRLGTALTDAAKPVAEHVPAPMKQVAAQVAEIAPPVRFVTGPAPGMTVHEAREQLYREGEALLRRSRQLSDPDEHPAMAMILKAISPDEARIIRYLGETGPQAVLDVVAHNPWTRKQRVLVHNFSIVAREAGCLRPDHGSIYLDNLSRLGVVVIPEYRLRSQRNYDFLVIQPQVSEVRTPKGRLVRLKRVYKGVDLSEFGKELFRVCFETKTSHLADVPEVL